MTCARHLAALPLPVGNTGTTTNRRMTTTERTRLTLELSPTVASLLEHVSDVTGTPKTQLVQSALVEVLPDILARADALAKRSKEISQAKPKQR